MLLTVAEFVSRNPDFATFDPGLIEHELSIIEIAIRAYTNNNFQERRARFEAESTGTTLLGDSRYIREGNTVQLTKTINEGLYVVTNVLPGYTTVDLDMFDEPYNMVTLVKYPKDVIDIAEKLLRWKLTDGSDGATGGDIQSETLGRHSVTYFKIDDQEAGSKFLNGYPVDILRSLDPYRKLRY